MKSKVYQSKNDIKKILTYLPKDLAGKTAVKVHFGEPGCTTYLNPEHAKTLCEELAKIDLKVSLVECNVLYKGQRSNRTDHIKTAKDHGFDFADIDICDGETGQDKWEIEINKKHFSSIMVGKNLQEYDNLITISHFKGHPANGFGGALKNVGMGLGSRAGKMAMHQAFNLIVDDKKCIGCGTCEKKCDACAITVVDQKAEIDFSKCLRCAGCIANCPQGAIEIPWGDSSSIDLQERIVEYCYGIMTQLNCPFYINVLEKITPVCDCFSDPQKPISPDLGFLASSDPVALDQASYDLLKQSLKKDIFQELHGIDSTRQLEYAEELGLGNREYELIEV